MRLVTARQGERQFAGMLDGDRVVPLRGIRELGRQTPLSLLRDPPLAQTEAVAIGDVTLLAPVPNPGKIICVGLNYATHVEETGRSKETYPVLFTKFATALVGPYDTISCPPESGQVDYEAELAVVIGEPARRIGRRDAPSVIAGYAVANDVTMRDFQYKTHQWLQGKSWDASTPLGPYLVTADELGGSLDLNISLTLNGDVMQQANTRQMIFDVPRLVSIVSEFTTLLPGDVILTGTPGGVGYRREPQVFLRPRDVVSVTIEGVGTIENTVIADVAGGPVR
jgi:acylpyruvate hydrolase